MVSDSANDVKCYMDWKVWLTKPLLLCPCHAYGATDQEEKIRMELAEADKEQYQGWELDNS